MGSIGNSRVYHDIHGSAKTTFEQALEEMAKFAFDYIGGTSEEAAQLLEHAGLKVKQEAINWFDQKHRNQGHASRHDPVTKLETAFDEAVRHAVDDFRHGIAGDAKLKKDPFVSVVSNISNSPSAVVQTAVGDQNQQSMQQQSSEIRQAIDDMLASDEFKNLDETNRTVIQDTADVARRVGEAERRPIQAQAVGQAPS